MGGDNEIGACEPGITQNILERGNAVMFNFIDRPVTWFRKNIVEANQKKSFWYHMQLRRVPTIDQCYTDDVACEYEADQQYKRDRKVDSAIVNILRYRMDDCVKTEFPDVEKCKDMKEAYDQAAENWFSKYGDLGATHTVQEAYMKQKHRMLWERRHGKIGNGMKKNEYAPECH